MCGRIALIASERATLKKRFHLKIFGEDLAPRYNISPSQNIPVILNDCPQELAMARWGLIPGWSKDENSKYKMINARAETITQKPAYRGPIKYKRCLVIADSYYEWKSSAGPKTPYRIMLKSDELFAFAGIWDVWKKETRAVLSCAIITTHANAMMKKIHERMPVILPKDKEALWLSNCPVEEAVALLQPYNSRDMKAYEISTLINSPKNNMPEVIAPVI